MSWFYCYQAEYLHGFYSFSGNINVRWKSHLIQVLILTTPRAPAPSQPGTIQRDFWIMIQLWAVLERFLPPCFFPLHQLLCNLQPSFPPVSSGHQLRYRRKDESCGSVNYLHLCKEDEQVPDMQKAVSRKQSQRGRVCWRAISGRADRALIVALCKPFEMKYLKNSSCCVILDFDYQSLHFLCYYSTMFLICSSVIHFLL